MLKGKIRFEIIVLVQVIGLSVAIAPVLVVLQAIGPDFVATEFHRTLFVLFRRAESRKYQGIALPYPFGDIQHVRPRIHSCAVHIAVPAHVRTEQAGAPAMSQIAGVQGNVALARTIVGNVRTSVDARFGSRCGSDDVYRASYRVVRKHRAPCSFLDLNRISGVREPHPVVPEHIPGGKPGNGDTVQQDGYVFLFEPADIDSGIPVAARFCRGIDSGNEFYKFRISPRGGPSGNGFVVYGVQPQR